MAPTLRQTFFYIMARTLSSEPPPPRPDPIFIRELYKNMEIAYEQTPFILSQTQVTDEMLHHWIPKLVDVLNGALPLGDEEQEKHIVEIFVGLGDVDKFYNYHKGVRGWNSTKSGENVVVFKKVILYVLEEIIKADPEQQLMYYWSMPPSAVLKLIKRYLYELYPDLLGLPPKERRRSILKDPANGERNKKRVSFSEGVQNQIPDLVSHPPRSPDEPIHAAVPTKFPFIADDAIENHLPTPQELDHIFVRENNGAAESKPRERLVLPEEETTPPAVRNTTNNQLNHLPRRAYVNHELPDGLQNEPSLVSPPNHGGLHNQSNWFHHYKIPDDLHENGADSEDEDEAPGLSRTLRSLNASSSARRAPSVDLHVENNKDALRVEPDAVKLQPFVSPPPPMTSPMKIHNKSNLKRHSSEDWEKEVVPPNGLPCSPKKQMLPEADWLLKREHNESVRKLRENYTELGLFIDPALGAFLHELPIEPQYRFVRTDTLHPSSDDCHTMIYLVKDKEWLLAQQLPVGPKMLMIVYDDEGRKMMNGQVKRVPGHKAPEELVREAIRVMVYEIHKRYGVEMKVEPKEEVEDFYGEEMPKRRGAESVQKKVYNQDEMVMAKEEEEEVILPKKVPVVKENGLVKSMVKVELKTPKSPTGVTPTKPHFDLKSIAKEDYTQVKLGLYIDPSLGFFTDLPIQPNFRFSRSCTLYPPTRSCDSMIYFVKDKDALHGQELPEGITMMMVVFDEEMKAQVRRIPRRRPPEPVVVEALRLMVHEMNRSGVENGRRKSGRMEELKNGLKNRHRA